MKSILYTSSEHSLNEIECFIDEICEEFKVSNSLYGNILITITESIKVLESFSKHGRITFHGDHEHLNFTFDCLKELKGTDSIFEHKGGRVTLASDPDKSIFMINALSDDLIIDREKKQICCVFKNEGNKAEISKHRKDFLKKYLGQEASVNA